MTKFNEKSDCIYIASAVNDRTTGIAYAYIVDDDCNQFIYIGFNCFPTRGYVKTSEFLNGAIKKYNEEEWMKIVKRFENVYNVFKV